MTEEASPVIAFDNTGTLSDVEVSVSVVSDDPTYDDPVPDIDPESPTALVGLAIEDFEVFDTDVPIGTVLTQEEIEVHLALSNVTVDEADIRQAVLDAEDIAGRSLLTALTALRDRLEETRPERPPVPSGVQLVVGLDNPRIHRIVAYTTVPRPGTRRVLGRLASIGWEVHIVSGDRAPILAAVATRLGVESENVHTDQSGSDKAATVRRLRDGGAPTVVMVGDYVNDIQAFQAADWAVLIVEPTEDAPPERLREAADVIVDSIDSVPEAVPSGPCREAK